MAQILPANETFAYPVWLNSTSGSPHGSIQWYNYWPGLHPGGFIDPAT